MKLSKGDYASERVGDACYYAFEDRKRVCFVSNVFPERMDSDIVRVQLDGSLQLQAIPPVLPAYSAISTVKERIYRKYRRHSSIYIWTAHSSLTMHDSIPSVAKVCLLQMAEKVYVLTCCFISYLV